MAKLDFAQQNLKKFGITMAVAFMVITGIILLKHRHSALPTLIIAVIFFIFAYIAPFVLKPVYILWMRLAFILSWVNTRLILTLIFYLVFTPIGLVLRVCGVDLLQIKIKKDKTSYWLKREPKVFSPTDYQRQF